jgi:hypothetical protein
VALSRLNVGKRQDEKISKLFLASNLQKIRQPLPAKDILPRRLLVALKISLRVIIAEAMML